MDAIPRAIHSYRDGMDSPRRSAGSTTRAFKGNEDTEQAAVGKRIAEGHLWRWNVGVSGAVFLFHIRTKIISPAGNDLPIGNGVNGSEGVSPTNVYFGGKLIRAEDVTVATDRLGSVRANANGTQINYFPYGEERTSTPDSTEKFGTYFKDPGGMYYADQRHYNYVQGRFLTPDPAGMKAANLPNPSTWNMYAYSSGDPVNFLDPTGLMDCIGDGGDGGGGGEAPIGFMVPSLVNTLNGAVASAISPGTQIPDEGVPAFTTTVSLEYTPIQQLADGILTGAGALMHPEFYGLWATASVAGGFDVAVGLAGEAAISLGNISPTITNPIPATLAREIPGDIPLVTLGLPTSSDVFVAATQDIVNMDASQIATRLGIEPSDSGFSVVEFPTPESGLASPVSRDNPGFGETSGGVREFVVPNGPIHPALIRRIPR